MLFSECVHSWYAAGAAAHERLSTWGVRRQIWRLAEWLDIYWENSEGWELHTDCLNNSKNKQTYLSTFNCIGVWRLPGATNREAALKLSREQQWEAPRRLFGVGISQDHHLLELKPVLTSWSLKECWCDLCTTECEREDMKVLLKHGFKRELSNPLIGHQKEQKLGERQYIPEYIDKSWDFPHSKEGQNV